ncbi:MAG: ABC transporter ATP-binding protein [Lachnospiraceae bacterium]|nr:ABC transporter ATP-binding protein [Lachnospiraceae bacterium]
MRIYKKLMKLMNRKQKRQMAVLVFLMLIGAVLESASITLVVPVIQVVLTPEAIEGEGIVADLYHGLHMQSITQFTVIVMAALILAFVLKNLFLFFMQKRLYHFVYTNQFYTAQRLLRSYIKKDYEYFLNADTATIQRSIAADVNNMYALILALLQVMSEAIVFVTLGVILLKLDALMTVVIASLLVLTLIVIKKVIKPIMNRTGKENQDYGASMYQWIAQAVTGIKEVKVTGKEQYFIDEYMKQGEGFIKAMERFCLFSNSPKLLIETVCIAGMVAYMLCMILAGNNVGDMLPVLGAFAVAAMRLMPSASRINNQLTQMAYCEPFFMNVSDNLVEDISEENTDLSYAVDTKEKLPVTREITLRDITYAYPNTEKLIFDHADLTIKVGSSIGIVGGSGAGKTTVVDIILGLLKLKSGTICADGVNVMEHYREWLKNIGYIPQMISLLDADIRKNVAFGVKEEEIDEEKLWYALKEAQLDEFVNSLPDKEYTGVGERGIRISGGQRQRIGIARALYNDPEVLILDEATSALDNDTEAAIMDSINRLHGRKTMIIIAHRLQTIEKCDEVYRVENGKITRDR